MKSISLKLDVAVDPHDDVSGLEFKEDLLYFVTTGGRNLVRALFWQTIGDLVESRKNPNAPIDVHVSAGWPKTPSGRSTIEFLMPGVAVDLIIAKIYEDPELFISKMKNMNKDAPVENTLCSAGAIQLDHDLAAQAFEEKPMTDESDQPLHGSQSYFDEHPTLDDDNTPGPMSWG